MNRFGYRHPQTKNERVALFNPDLAEYSVRVRAARLNLPDAWDDNPVGRCRCWKDHRESQAK